MKSAAYIKEYGIKSRLLPSFYSKTKNYDKMHEYYLKYIQKNYGYIYEKYKNSTFVTDKSMKCNNVIWFLWWQGEENMPQTVKLCLESVKKHASGKKVVVLNEKNYSKYMKIPDYIVEKYKKGYISHAHMSDVLRIFLLSEHGGTWIDATLLVSSSFDENIKEYAFYTVNKFNENSNCITKGKWVVGFMHAGNTHMILFEVLKDLYLAYWKEHNIIVTYLLMDYFIELAYRKIPSIKEEIDKVPPNNYGMYDLTKIINCPFDEGKWEEIKGNAFLHRLSWRYSKYEEASKGDTIYKRLLEGKLS